MNDRELLRRFATGGEGASAAFREVVERHQDWVYSVCRRRIGDPGLAEDAAQGVFLALARKAGEVAGRSGGVEGWLFEAARFASANVRRERGRRMRHEQEAGVVKKQEARSKDQEGEVAGELNEALATLVRVDGVAVLLRFYRGETFAVVGEAMGESEEAAKKRVGRAVEKLRGIWRRRGVGMPAAGIAGLLVSEMVRPAPNGFAAKVMGGVETGAASSSALRVMRGILRRRLVMGVKVAVVAGMLAICVPAVILAAGGGNATESQEGTVAAVAATEPEIADMTTPLGAMRMFNDALVRSDAAELQRVLYAETPQQQQMADVMVETMKQMAELKKELGSRFGETAAQSRALRMGGQMDLALLDAELQLDGDHAEVRFPSMPAGQAFELVKVKGEWRIAMAELLNKHQTAEQEKKYLAVIQKQGERVAGIVTDLKSGKVTTLAEVKSRLARRG